MNFLRNGAGGLTDDLYKASEQTARGLLADSRGRGPLQKGNMMMKWTVWIAVAIFLGGCVEMACPENTKAVDGRCVLLDNSGTGGSDASENAQASGSGGNGSETGGTQTEADLRALSCGDVDLSQATEAANVLSDEIWSGVMHVTSDLTVSDDATLTIEAGTLVVVDAEASIYIGDDWSGATLIADGTEDQPIIFCGAQATKGFWGGLTIDSKATTDSVLRHVTIADAGAFSGAIAINPAITIDHVTVENSGGDGVLAAAFHKGSTDLSVIDSDGRAVALYSSDAVSTFPLGGTFTGNADNIVALEFDSIDTNVTFHNLGIPYVQEEIDLLINCEEATFEAGVTYRFGADGTLEVGPYNGSTKLQIAGTADAPVTFEGTTHEKGFWGGILIKREVLTSSSITHARFADGGGIARPLDINSAILIQDVEFDGNAQGFAISDDGLKVGSANVSVTHGDGDFVATVSPNGLPTFPVGGTFTDNTVNEIKVPGTHITATITSTGTVPNPGIPYVIAGDLWMEDGSDWSIAPGTEFIVEQDVTIQVWPYVDTVGFVAVGTVDEPIVFRGREDQVGYWTGIDMRADVTPQTALDYVEIHNAGKAGSAALTLQGPVDVTNTTITKSAGYGILHDSSDSTDYATTNTFTDNADGAVGAL